MLLGLDYPKNESAGAKAIIRQAPDERTKIYGPISDQFRIRIFFFLEIEPGRKHSKIERIRRNTPYTEARCFKIAFL